MTELAIQKKIPKQKPAFVFPMQCKLVSSLPDDVNWHYEIKWDGFRAMAVRERKAVDLISRNEKKLNKKYPAIVRALAALRSQQFVIDGEIVAIDESGLPSFQLLQRVGGEDAAVLFYAFDLLNYNGVDLTLAPIEERKRMLSELLDEAESVVRYSAFLPGDPAALVAAARQQGLEGLIGKRKGSVYEAGRRSGTWVKYKTENEQEFVIGGFRSAGRADDFDLLFAGYYDNKEFRYAGKVKSGFTPYLKRTIRRKLQGLETKACPFGDVPESKGGRWGENLTREDIENSVWVKPRVVCRIRFTEWTHHGHLRHPVFVALREDKNAAGVVRETV